MEQNIKTELPLSVDPIPPEQRQESLRQFTRKIKDPPVLSTVGMNLIHELRNEISSVEKIAKIIRSEPTLAAKVLRHANSAYAGVTHQIRTVRHATVMLGLDSIKEMAFNLCFYSYSRSLFASRSEFAEKYLKRCLATATLAKKICKHFKFSNVGSGEAHLAGLLANIGIFLLYQSSRDQYAKILQQSQSDEMPLYLLEEQTLGFNHTDMGGWLAKKWGLPESLTEVIRSHHRVPEETANLELIAIIQLSDLVCDRMGVNLASENPQSEFDPAVIKIFKQHLPDKTPEDILNQAMTTFGSVCLSAGEATRELENGSESPKSEKSEKPKPTQTPIPSKTPSETIITTSPIDWGSRIAGILLCGLGHLLLGQTQKGSLFLILFVISVPAFFLLSGMASTLAGIIALLIWGVSIGDLWTLTSPD